MLCKILILAFLLNLNIDLQAQNSELATELLVAENFVDSFYSFNPERLKSILLYAKKSMPKIVYYQGWAKGGNYTVAKRKRCVIESSQVISCSITVIDDLMLALAIDFNVTDTFHMSFSEGKIISVRTSSNDLQVFRDAEKWVWREHAELVNGPCKGYFADGSTPERCVKAMIKGYALFAKMK